MRSTPSASLGAKVVRSKEKVHGRNHGGMRSRLFVDARGAGNRADFV